SRARLRLRRHVLRWPDLEARELIHDAKIASRHSGAHEVRTRNLEIPRCAIAHLRFALRAPRNDAHGTATKQFSARRNLFALATKESRNRPCVVVLPNEAPPGAQLGLYPTKPDQT